MLLVCCTSGKTHIALIRNVIRCSDANIFVDIPISTMLYVVDLFSDKGLSFLTSVGDVNYLPDMNRQLLTSFPVGKETFIGF